VTGFIGTLSWRPLSNQALVLVEASGVLTDADVLAAQERLRADPDFRGYYFQLVDLQRVSAFEVSGATARQLAQQDLWGPQARRAFVVTPGAAFGLARMFELLTDERAYEVRVFTTMPEARPWLGLPREMSGRPYEVRNSRKRPLMTFWSTAPLGVSSGRELRPVRVLSAALVS
jgi:hypothetical protein